MARHTIALGSDLAARAAARGARERPWLQSKPVKDKLATICQAQKKYAGCSPEIEFKAAKPTMLQPSKTSVKPIDRRPQCSPETKVNAAKSTKIPMLRISTSTEPIGRCSPTSPPATRPEVEVKTARPSRIPIRMVLPIDRRSVAVTSCKSSSSARTWDGPSEVEAVSSRLGLATLNTTATIKEVTLKSALRTTKGPSKTVHWSPTVTSTWFDVHECAAIVNDNLQRLVPHSPNVNTRRCGEYSEHGMARLSAAHPWKFSNQAINPRKALDGLSLEEEAALIMATIRAKGPPRRHVS